MGIKGYLAIAAVVATVGIGVAVWQFGRAPAGKPDGLRAKSPAGEIVAAPSVRPATQPRQLDTSRIKVSGQTPKFSKGPADTARLSLVRPGSLPPGELDRGLEQAEGLLREKRFDEAVRLLEKLRAAQPKEPRIRFRLAMAYDWSGRHDLAAEEARLFIRMNPGSREAAELQRLLDGVPTLAPSDGRRKP